MKKKGLGIKTLVYNFKRNVFHCFQLRITNVRLSKAIKLETILQIIFCFMFRGYTFSTIFNLGVSQGATILIWGYAKGKMLILGYT